MSDGSGSVLDRLVDLARLSPLLVAFLFFVVAVLTAMNVGVVPALEPLVVGWVLVFPPLAAVVWTLLGRPEFVPWPFGDDEVGEPDGDPLEVLRDRYARGEISEAEFEERLDRLLEAEAATEPNGGNWPRSTAEYDPELERE
jgi:uncharacterized membrane protein